MWEDDDDINDGDVDPEQERKRVEALPVYQKAEEIRELTRQIIETTRDERVRVIHMNCMLDDSIIIPDKIAAAEASDDFISKMENATLVKLHARSLQKQCASLVFEDALPKEYLALLSKEIESFRVLFRDWVAGFRNLQGNDDGWGLYS
jgi:hypothetical protein